MLRRHLLSGDRNRSAVVLVSPPKQNDEKHEHEKERVQNHKRDQSCCKRVAAPEHTRSHVHEDQFDLERACTLLAPDLPRLRPEGIEGTDREGEVERVHPRRHSDHRDDHQKECACDHALLERISTERHDAPHDRQMKKKDDSCRNHDGRAFRGDAVGDTRRHECRGVSEHVRGECLCGTLMPDLSDLCDDPVGLPDQNDHGADCASGQDV